MESIETNSSGHEQELSAKKQRSQGSFDSNESGSGSSQEGATKSKGLPTFTNEVVIIRPEQFYENEDC